MNVTLFKSSTPTFEDLDPDALMEAAKRAPKQFTGIPSATTPAPAAQPVPRASRPQERAKPSPTTYQASEDDEPVDVVVGIYQSTYPGIYIQSDLRTLIDSYIDDLGDKKVCMAMFKACKKMSQSPRPVPIRAINMFLSICRKQIEQQEVYIKRGPDLSQMSESDQYKFSNLF